MYTIVIEYPQTLNYLSHPDNLSIGLKRYAPLTILYAPLTIRCVLQYLCHNSIRYTFTVKTF
jgi:hypothetical protein